MIKSSYTTIKDIIIFEIDINDLYLNNYTMKLFEILKNLEKNKIILNLEKFDVITTKDIEKINLLIDFFKLTGKKIIVCGINPYSASLIFTFLNQITFKTTLNVQSALDEFSNK